MAFHISPIDTVHAAERAVARAPVTRQTPTQSSLVQELARTVTAASTASSTTTSSTSSSNSATATTAGAGNTSSSSSATAAATASASSSSDSPPTAESVFGSNPWDADPTGTGPGGTYTYNPYYFATAQTAATVASMVGGTVVAVEEFGQSPGNPFVQNQPNEMVELSNGTFINPGLVAAFYTHGYPQSMVDQMIANEVTNVSKGT